MRTLNADKIVTPRTARRFARRAARPLHVFAAASAGGHLVQLLRLAPAFAGCRVSVVTTQKDVQSQIPTGLFLSCSVYHVVDANAQTKCKSLLLLVKMSWLLLRLRPNAIFTTGAAPGYFAIRLAKLLGIRTIWFDSMANAEELSLSGKRAMRHCDLTFTQWRHLSSDAQSIRFAGAVL